MRRTLPNLLVLLIPSAVLVLLIAAGRVLGGGHYLNTGLPGTVLYAADFAADAPFTADWDRYDDGQLAASVADGRLTIRAGRAGAAAFSSAAPHFSDFDVRVRLSAVDGPVDNGFGVIFRLQDNDNTQIADDRYYAFQISSDGYYRLVRRIDGEEREVSTWIQSPIVRAGLGVVNDIRVIARGATFRFFINDQPAPLCIPDDPAGRSVYFMDTCRDGQMLETWMDAAIPAGQFGLLALATETGGPGVVVQTDHVIVLGAPEA